MAMVAALMVAAVAVAPSPAQAEVTVNGCKNTGWIRACISLDGTYLRGDFYLIGGPDSTVCKASLTLFRNGAYTGVAQGYDLTYRGVYGPVWFNADLLPDKSQTAFTRVYVYTCDWTLHYVADSNPISFIA